MFENNESNEGIFSFNTLKTDSGDDINRTIRLCFDHYCPSGSDGLTRKSFTTLLEALFVNEENTPYHMPVQWIQELFGLFDTNKDEIISWTEFELMWNNWIQTILAPKSALVVVDVQNDFISGSLAINQCPAGHNGEDVIPVINRLIDSVPFDEVVYSQDWHPRDHISFFENKHIRRLESMDESSHSNSSTTVAQKEVKLYDTVVFEGQPPMRQTLWPIHCVQESWGAELHPNLMIKPGSAHVYKGTQSHIDSYSVFWDNQRLSQTNLNLILQSLDITDLYVCGLALDVCVGYTALDATEFGYRTVIIDDGSRGLYPNAIDDIKDRLSANKAIFVNSSKVLHMVNGADRRPELGFALAFKPLGNRKQNKSSEEMQINVN